MFWDHGAPFAGHASGRRDFYAGRASVFRFDDGLAFRFCRRHFFLCRRGRHPSAPAQDQGCLLPGILRFWPGAGKLPVVKIILNGKETEVEGSKTLLDLLEERKITPQMVACEINSQLIRRKEFSKAEIHDGDRIEILQMIGGG